MIYWFAIAISNYRSTSFRNADLTNADFSNANLRQADFRNANLTRTRWHQAKFLAQARTDEEYLEDPKIRQLVVSLNGREQNFDQFDLRGLNLDGADLTDASFIGAKLSGATLKDAKLDGAKLVQAQLYGADLSGASLTGAYIQDWSISTDTIFDNVQCDYVYMQLPTKIDPDPCRKPDKRNENFESGDFADFIEPIIKTLNLYQTQNIDLRVVAQQFKTLDLFHH
ncbi:MAG: pentapeptide repeat-containing protein, partial [Cyanobacteria bacterium P01_D01_bin.128]